MALILSITIGLYLVNQNEEYSPELCSEYELDSREQISMQDNHKVYLESEHMDLAIINIDGNRELFEGYSPNYYKFGKVRVSFYGPEDNKIRIEFCS